MYRASQRASSACGGTPGLSFDLGFPIHKSMPEDVPHIISENELHFFADLFVDVFEIPLVQCGKNDSSDLGTMRRENLFLDTTHRQDLSTKRDLPGHRDLAVDSLAGEQGKHGCSHGYAG